WRDPGASTSARTTRAPNPPPVNTKRGSSPFVFGSTIEALPRFAPRCWYQSSRLAVATAKVSRPTLPGYSDLPRCRWFGRRRTANPQESQLGKLERRGLGALGRSGEHPLVRALVPGAHRRHVEPTEDVRS